MRTSKLTKAAALAFGVVWAAGCSTSSTTDTAQTATDTDGSATQGVGVGSDVTGVTIEDLANLRTVFYFDFDQSVLKAESYADLEKHAAYLSQNPSASVVLEGHADERGTREYNIALGERRALSVSRFMQVNGVSGGQVEVVSFGEEKPAVVGHSESSWSQNRRVELKYTAR
ncbi:peptidoglycan-associated lipoprotein Pal [Pontibacter sp. JAM-7]|uniref:peptidoglycan-associated lipoprotein Pal n=1 Tax=Pontibacter sp. JAM-7 TaxID=3366581 RepID=UPI003AF935BE